MLIIGKNIIERRFLEGASEGSLRSGSYYLRINCIIPAGEEAKQFDHSNPKTAHTLKPGGLAWVISEEFFCIEDYSVTALVTLRSTFTKQGMLALDVGLVDANYNGPIGSVVINFSKNEIHLAKGEEFFRVIFFEHSEIEERFRYPPTRHTREEYITTQLKSLTSAFPGSFLQANEIGDRLSQSIQKNIVEELNQGLLDKLIVNLVKSHWMAILIFFAILMSAIIGVDRYLLPSLLSVDRQKEIVCEMIENGVLEESTAPQGTCL